jgi:hypothetical protein
VSNYCFDFHYANGYIMIGDCVLANVKFYKALMLKYDDAQRGSEL